VARRFALIVLLPLAAGLMMTLLAFQHAAAAQCRQAMANQPVRFTHGEAVHFDAQIEWWYYRGAPSVWLWKRAPLVL
jgi:predicted secreted hydrolase